jgi:E3 ubiquitin-protein ligase RNF14
MCTDDVRCPELQCGIKFNYDTIKNILLLNKDKKLFERYDRFLIHHQLEQLDEFIWCSNPKCQMGQLNDGGQLNNIVTCIYCHKKTCFMHKTKWHEGLTCQEYDSITNRDLKANLRWLNQNTKTCPNCPYQIEKNNGCDHMTCIKCQYEFCWSCLANYDQIRREGNHRHNPNCKHYASYDKI